MQDHEIVNHNRKLTNNGQPGICRGQHNYPGCGKKYDCSWPDQGVPNTWSYNLHTCESCVRNRHSEALEKK